MGFWMVQKSSHCPNFSCHIALGSYTKGQHTCFTALVMFRELYIKVLEVTAALAVHRISGVVPFSEG